MTKKEIKLFGAQRYLEDAEGGVEGEEGGGGFTLFNLQKVRRSEAFFLKIRLTCCHKRQ